MTDTTAAGPSSINGSGLAGSAADVLGGAIDGLRQGAETQKNAGADAVAGFARAVRETAAGLETQSPQIAQAVRLSADTVERLSQDVKNRNVYELLDATAAFARRKPFVFLSLGIAAGIVLSRALANSR